MASVETKRVIERIASNDASLTHVNLSAQLIDDIESTQALAKALKRNTNLLSIDLSDNHLLNAGAIALSRGLRANKSLESINLCGNNIGVRGGYAIWSSMGPERHQRAKLDLTKFDNIINDAIIRLKRSGIDERISRAVIASDSNIEGLRAYTEDLMSSNCISPAFLRREDMARCVHRRVKYLLYLQVHPEVRNIEIKNPVVITGLYRTGTTMLFNLMSTCPGVRSPMLWEILDPVPPPTKEKYLNDGRIEICQRWCDGSNQMGLATRSVHNMEPFWPEECMFIMREEFYWTEYILNNTCKHYQKWFKSRPIEEIYNQCKVFYQLLSSTYPPDTHWLMKAPYHMFHLREMVNSYSPENTKIILCHRDPADTVGSSLSLWVGLAVAEWADYDVITGSRHILNALAEMWERGLKFIDEFEAEGQGHRLAHSFYKDLMADPVKEVTRIHAELKLADPDPAAITQWLEENPQGKHGKHAYSLEKYGLTTEDVYDAFYNYYVRFYPELLPKGYKRSSERAKL